MSSPELRKSELRVSEIVELRLSCYRHRARFKEILEQENFAKYRGGGERFRRVFIKAVMRNYPEGFLRHLEEATCIGCAFEKSGPRCYQWAEDALRAICRGKPVPQRIVKHWTEQGV
jgi:hypothetical protein